MAQHIPVSELSGAVPVPPPIDGPSSVQGDVSATAGEGPNGSAAPVAMREYILADTPDGAPVGINFEQIVGQHTLIAAMTGFGKSVTARKMMELSLRAGLPIIVLDSDGDLFSLRDVAPNGILVVGGEHGAPGIAFEDVLGRLREIVTKRGSIVFDIYDLEHEEQARIVAEVAKALMEMPKELQQPYLLVIDEVQRFAGQRRPSEAFPAIIDVAKRGRKRGISLLVATQRVADVSKELTSQMTNRLFGHVSDVTDRKRVADEIGLSLQAAGVLAELERGEFLVRGSAFGGALDRVRIQVPVSGSMGKDHLVEKLRLPVAPITEVLALFDEATSLPAKQDGSSERSARRFGPQVAGAVQTQPDSRPDEGGHSLEARMLAALATSGSAGLEKDSLALLAGTTERRREFQEAVSALLARKLIGLGTGAKIKITAAGLAVIGAGAASVTAPELLVRLLSRRDRNDQRIVACLSAAGHAPVDPIDIRTRTGLGPRVLKQALQRLKRDGWIVERRGAVATSPALARLAKR